MFIASKLLGSLLQPLAWVALLLLAGVLLQRRRPPWARRTFCAALLLLLGTGWLPAPSWLVWQLESRYPEIAPQQSMDGYVGVVVLGGAMASGRLAQAHSQPLLNDSATRMTAAVALLRHNPRLQLLFTGGEGLLLGSGPSEAERAHAFFASMGVAEDAVRYESAARTTQENALLSARLPGVAPQQPWLLLTSAWHMPRAMACFEKAGWNVHAYPVDFRGSLTTPWYGFDLLEGAQLWQLLLHEALGLAAYRALGRI